MSLFAELGMRLENQLFLEVGHFIQFGRKCGTTEIMSSSELTGVCGMKVSLLRNINEISSTFTFSLVTILDFSVFPDFGEDHLLQHFT